MSSIITRWLFASFLSFSLISCKEDEKSTTIVTPDVNVVIAGKQDLPIFTEYVGQTLGLSDVNIEPRIEGWITGIHFKEGSLVQKGSLLYTIDDAPALTKIDAAKAEVAKSQTLMINKKSDLDRVKPLAEMNALSQRDLDAATAAYEASQNEVEIARAQLNNANIELGYTRITAPLTGVIGISKVQVGDYVSKVSLENGINSISALGEIRVRFAISENDYLQFAREYRKDPNSNNFAEVPVELLLSDGTLFNEKGKLQLTNRQIDQATGSIIVQAIFKNAQGLVEARPIR